MPNIKSAKKRVALSKVANERNKMDKSALKTTIKKFDAAVAEGNREKADAAYKAAVTCRFRISTEVTAKPSVIRSRAVTPCRRVVFPADCSQSAFASIARSVRIAIVECLLCQNSGVWPPLFR